MAKQLQLVVYEGYLAADPEMHYTPQGKSVTNFRMGSNNSYKDAEGNQVDETTWLKVTCWGKRGEAINQYCAKGSWVVVTGRLRAGKDGSPTTYQLKTTGEWKASYEITSSDVRILKGKDGATPPPVSDSAAPEDDAGEIPF